MTAKKKAELSFKRWLRRKGLRSKYRQALRWSRAQSSREEKPKP